MSTMRPLRGRSRSRAALVEQDNGRLDASKAGDARTPSARTLHGLDWFNFFLADVQTGIGPFLAIYLAGYGGTRSAWESRSPSAESPES